LTTVVLLVLALIWGALLVSWLRSRSQGTLADSVGTFQRHLTVLERATPAKVAPANRMRDAPLPFAQHPRAAAFGSPHRARSARAVDAPVTGRPAAWDAPVAARAVGAPVSGRAGALDAPFAPGRNPVGRPSSASAALRRRQAQKRRRDVFFALLAGVGGSLVLALIPGLSIMWSVQVLFDVLLAGYVALLVHARNVAAERELKLRFMPPQASRGAVPRASYDFGGAYGQLGLRRAAN
jgi:hypothetical protein